MNVNHFRNYLESAFIQWYFSLFIRPKTRYFSSTTQKLWRRTAISEISFTSYTRSKWNRPLLSYCIKKLNTTTTFKNSKGSDLETPRFGGSVISIHEKYNKYFNHTVWSTKCDILQNHKQNWIFRSLLYW